MPSDTTSSTDLADHVITLTGRIRRALRRADDASGALAATGDDDAPNLTMSQEAVMGHLSRGGPLSTAELARLEGVRPQSMRLTVGGLEDLGIVARTPDPDDARKSLLDLTDAGRDARESAFARRSGILASRLDDRLDDDERACLDRALGLLDRVVGEQIAPRGAASSHATSGSDSTAAVTR